MNPVLLRRPLLWVALSYVAGLLVAEAVAVPVEWPLAAGLLLTLAALSVTRLRPWLLPAIIVCAGWANLASHTQVLAPHDMRAQFDAGFADVTVRGRLAESPSLRLFVRDEQESFRTLAVVQVEAVRCGGDWRPAHGRVMTVTPEPLGERLSAGTPVEVSGILSPPPLPLAPGLFNYRAHLAREGIWFQLRVRSAADWIVLVPTPRPWGERFVNWAQTTLARGLPERDEPLRLIYSMTLGWRGGLTQETYVPFMRSGTMHLFAISGLHIALIAGILVALLRGVRLPRAVCGLVAVPLLWFYAGATGWQSSAVRASLMMTVIIGGWALGRPGDLLNSLAAAALLILAWEPQQLFQASFQLSFFVVLSIALLTPPLQRRADRWLAHDPFQPRETLPRWRRWLTPPARWVALTFATSLAAWLGSLPLTMHYFHLFSPVALLANLLVVPMGGAALASALGGLLCGAWLPWIGELFNHGAWFWMRGMLGVSEWAAGLPGAFWQVRSPAPADFAIYYALLLLLLSGWLLQPGRRRWLGVLAAGLAVFYTGRALAERRTAEITVLPLQGSGAVFSRAPGSRAPLLVDCGNTNAARFVTIPFLRAQGVNRLPHLLLTHGDLRAVGAAADVRAEFRIPTLLASPVRSRSRVYRDLTDAARAAGELTELTPPAAVAGWRLLHPTAADRFPQADDNAVVLLGEFHGTRVLLLSDLGPAGQSALASRETDLRAHIIVAGLPERTRPLMDTFLAAVRPQLVIVTDAEFPAQRRAPADLFARIEAAGAQWVSTRAQGAISLRITPSGWTARGMNGLELNVRTEAR